MKSLIVYTLLILMSFQLQATEISSDPRNIKPDETVDKLRMCVETITNKLTKKEKEECRSKFIDYYKENTKNNCSNYLMKCIEKCDGMHVGKKDKPQDFTCHNACYSEGLKSNCE